MRKNNGMGEIGQGKPRRREIKSFASRRALPMFIVDPSGSTDDALAGGSGWHGKEASHAMNLQPYIAEFVGTAIVVLLGNGVVANVLLDKTKGHGAGWIVITFGWGMAVFVGVFCTSTYSGAHLN